MDNKEKTILCIGNSHTAGFPHYDPYYGGDPLSSYEYYLEHLLQELYPNLTFQLDNQGICGEFSTDIFNRLITIGSKKTFDYTLFWGGANDIGMGRSVERILTTLQKVQTYFEDLKGNYFIINIPPMNILGLNKYVIELNQGIHDRFKEKSIDVYSSLADNGQLKKEFGIGDGVHLSEEGYKQVAKTIFHKFKENGIIQS